MTKYIEMSSGWIKAVADDYQQAPASAPVVSVPPKPNPLMQKAVQQLKAQGLKVTSEHILAAMELSKAGYPLNIPNLAQMVSQQQRDKRRAERQQPVAEPTQDSKASRAAALQKVLLDPQFMAQLQRESAAEIARQGY